METAQVQFEQIVSRGCELSSQKNLPANIVAAGFNME
jgi:hypothetical protein